MAKVPYATSHAVNNNDHGPIIITVAAVLLVCSSLVLILRLWMRWPWKAMFGGDDYCTIAAHVRYFAQSYWKFGLISPRFLLLRKHALPSPLSPVDLEKEVDYWMLPSRLLLKRLVVRAPLQPPR